MLRAGKTVRAVIVSTENTNMQFGRIESCIYKKTAERRIINKKMTIIICEKLKKNKMYRNLILILKNGMINDRMAIWG